MSFSRFARLRPFAIESFLMLRGIILGVHVLLALMIIGLVLLQRGQGRGSGGRFRFRRVGHGVRRPRYSTLFSKLTAVFAAMFFATSLTLAYIGARPSNEPTSVLERAAQAAAAAPAPAPTAPAAAPATPATAPAAPAAAPETPGPNPTAPPK